MEKLPWEVIGSPLLEVFKKRLDRRLSEMLQLTRAVSVFVCTDEIMQQDIRPLVAVDIIEQLHRQFAILSGGRGTDGAPIITFPEYAGFSDIPDEDFLNVVTYLTSIPSLEAASIGFIIIIDRRRDKWSAVKASLTRIAVSAQFLYVLIFTFQIPELSTAPSGTASNRLLFLFYLAASFLG
uniref:MCF.2 cell line derived transforming sequence-like 2 n=1 Tax=Sphenodon punctatus TaxID=8508 RepID=A0A8D0HE53_SPHPU